MEKLAKIRALKKEISKISLEKIEKDQISINEDLLDSLKTSPTTISMSTLEDLCVSLGINLSEMVDTLDVEIETKAIKLAKEEKSKKEEEELRVKIQALKDENKELIITLIEELREEEDTYRCIEQEVVKYFVVVSKEGIGEKQIKGLLEEQTEYERKYEEYSDRYENFIEKQHKLKKTGKNKFGFIQESTDEHGEFTYTYSLIESKKITSERLAELIKPSFLFHLDSPRLYSISDDLVRTLFFSASRLGKQVIPIIKGIGKEEFNELFDYLKKELKF